MARQKTTKQKILDFLLGVWLVLGGIAYWSYMVGALVENAWWGWAIFIGLGVPWCRWVWYTENGPKPWDKPPPPA